MAYESVRVNIEKIALSIVEAPDDICGQLSDLLSLLASVEQDFHRQDLLEQAAACLDTLRELDEPASAA